MHRQRAIVLIHICSRPWAREYRYRIGPVEEDIESNSKE